VSKQANPTLIGAFVLGALAVAIVATLALAGGSWFGEKRKHVLYFEGAAQGLQVGAPVLFLGVKVGNVKEIQLGLDHDHHQFVVPVLVEIQPNVVRAQRGEPFDLRDRDVVRRLVDRGLRGQLRMQSLLTGQLYVDLDFHPDKPARFVALEPELSEIPTIPTPVEQLTTTLQSFAWDKFLADVSAIGSSVNKLTSDPATQELPRRLNATLRHLEALTARLDAESEPILGAVREDLAGAHGALEATQKAMAKVDAAADRVSALAAPDSPTLANLTRAGDELAKAAESLRQLTARASPTVEQTNAALKEIARAADAVRRFAELLNEQPDALYRGKREKSSVTP
jgi:paraquat-inducible protein B